MTTSIRFRPATLLAMTLLTMTLLAGTGCQRAQPDDRFNGVVELEPRSLGFEVSGKVLEVNVHRGDRVKAGDMLARLDDSLERAQRPIRQADLAGAEARLQLLEAGPRGSDIRTLKAQLSAAASRLEAANRDLEREKELFERGATTRAMLDARQTQLEVTHADRDAASQRLRTIEAGSRVQEIRAAAAARDAAAAGLAALDERLSHYVLHAPAAGEILDVVTLAGEVVGAGSPIVLFAEPDRPYIDIFLPVPRLAGVHVGEAATVTPDGDPESYAGRVEQISQTTEYTPRYLLTEKDRASLVTRVRIRIADPQTHLHGGVPARVSLEGKDAPLPAGSTQEKRP